MHFELLKLLADGKFPSGEALASSLSVSRTAIWKLIPRIRALGLELHSVKGKGYRLQEKLNLLDGAVIMAKMPDRQRRRIAEIQVFPEIDSTSSYTYELAQKGKLNLKDSKVFVCFAEQQSAGRGRRGRSWSSPFGHNLYLTLAREFATGISELEGLSLVVGLALVRALQGFGFTGLGVKWPNDILWQGRKLAGILMEISGDPTGLTRVMIGMGLNVKTRPAEMTAVDQPWVDLSSIRAELPERNQLAAGVLNEMLLALEVFEQEGFAAFKTEWDNHDALRHQAVDLRSGSDRSAAEQGIVLGVDDHGALLLETAAGVKSFHGGELSPRVIETEH